MYVKKVLLYVTKAERLKQEADELKKIFSSIVEKTKQ
jgi:hypothetical protein